MPMPMSISPSPSHPCPHSIHVPILSMSPSYPCPHPIHVPIPIPIHVFVPIAGPILVLFFVLIILIPHPPMPFLVVSVILAGQSGCIVPRFLRRILINSSLVQLWAKHARYGCSALAWLDFSRAERKEIDAYQATDCNNVLFWLLVPSGGRIESGPINMASHCTLASN